MKQNPCKQVDYASIVTCSKTPVLATPKELGVCLVTGSAGLLGRHLVDCLLDLGLTVRAMVRSTALDRQHENLQIVRGDLNTPQQLEEACDGVDTIFHAAAMICLLGGKYVTDQYRQQAWQANVYGTQNLLNAAKKKGCKRLIYTSSIDVCFDGAYAPQMSESMPYAANPQSIYGESKIETEKRVLGADRQGGLHTCAMRPSGIYSGDANEMIDRFVEELLAGKLKMRIGSSEVKTDTSQVDNLVHAQVLAALHLVDDGAACAQAYFIHDNAVQNPFEFYRPIIEVLGHKVPSLSLPAGLLRPFMALQQALHFKFGIAAPMLSPHELDKISITHWASTAKAQKQLGYQPIKSYQQAIEESVTYCKKAAGL